MFCRKCGVQIPEGETRCPACDIEIIKAAPVLEEMTETGEKIVEEVVSPVAEKKTQIKFKINEFSNRGKAFVTAHKNRRTVLIVIVCIGIIFAGLLAMKFNCDTKGCNEFISEGSYCGSHKCWTVGCKNEREKSDTQCSLHIALSEFEAKAGLNISSVYVTSNSVSAIARGTVKNTSSTHTYKFVKLKGAFKDYSGKVIDTDWTYAVGSEGLAPGESVSFDIYVDKNYSIDECEVTVMDYDYE